MLGKKEKQKGGEALDDTSEGARSCRDPEAAQSLWLVYQGRKERPHRSVRFFVVSLLHSLVICLACRYLSIPLETFFRGLKGPFPSHHKGDKDDETDEDDATDENDATDADEEVQDEEKSDAVQMPDAGQGAVQDAVLEYELSGDEDEPLCQLSKSEYENVTAKVLQARLKHAGASTKGKKKQLFQTWKALPAIKQLQSMQAEFKPTDCAVLPGDSPCSSNAVVLLTNAAAAEEAPPQLRRRRNKKVIESDSENEELPKPAENLPKELQDDPSVAENQQDISVPVDMLNMQMQTDEQADGQLIIAAFQGSNDGAPEYRTKWDGKSLKDSLTYSVVIDSPHLDRDLVGAELKLRWLMNRFFTPHAYLS